MSTDDFDIEYRYAGDLNKSWIGSVVLVNADSDTPVVGVLSDFQIIDDVVLMYVAGHRVGAETGAQLARRVPRDD